jgi:hypothetical protein
MFLDAKVTASQKDVTQKYHNPIEDSFVKYTTVIVIKQDMTNGTQPSHCKAGDLKLHSITDMQPRVHNDK